MSGEVKVCSKCHLEQPISEFVVTDKARGYRRGFCRKCDSARVRAYYATNADYRARCGTNSRKWAAENRDKIPAYARKAKLKADYGLTPEQFDQLFELQERKCALCGATEHGRVARGGHNWLPDSWPVDHDHAQGHVRGLLCHPCNVQLGGYEVLLEKVGEAKLLEYLTRPSPVLALPVVVAEPVSEPRFVSELPPRYTRGQCTVCGEDQHARGLCFKHYMRDRRGGTTDLSGPITGSAHHKSSLTEDQAREIKQSTEKGAVLARRFGVSPSVISSIRTGLTWKHLGQAATIITPTVDRMFPFSDEDLCRETT